MIFIKFDPEALSGKAREEWDSWLRLAEAATNRAIEAWENESRHDFDSAVWTRLKRWLLEHVFHGKCAYCETQLAGARQPGDAEHFRPKGSVNYRESGDDPPTYVPALAEDETTTPPRTVQHPGYFWLAYNWKNLLPACNFCNRAPGKKDQFPIRRKRYGYLHKLTEEQARRLKAPPYHSHRWSGAYYLAPEDLNDLEGPLLLHPYFDADIGRHLDFDSRGQVYARRVGEELSARGTESIEVYALASEDLRVRRQAAQEVALAKFAAAVAYFRTCKGQSRPEAIEAAWKEPPIRDVVTGVKEYSAAVLSALREEYGPPPGGEGQEG